MRAQEFHRRHRGRAEAFEHPVVTVTHDDIADAEQRTPHNVHADDTGDNPVDVAHLVTLYLDPVELLAADQERLVVDAFVRYRIINGTKYYEALRDELGAAQKLNSIMDSTLRDVLGRVDTPEIIAGRRAELTAEIQDVSNEVAQTQELGVEIIDVRIKRADLPKENAERVFARMVTQREQEASLKRAEGEERAQEIRATAEKEATVIRAKAREQSEIIRGEGDKERNALYNAAFEKDADFFEFYRSMEAYKKSLKEGTTYVLSPDSEFLEFLNDQSGGRR